MINTYINGIELKKALRIKEKLSKIIRQDLSIHWSCSIEYEYSSPELKIRYRSYEPWKVQELIEIFEILRGSEFRHSYTHYYNHSLYSLTISVAVEDVKKMKRKR